MCSGHTLEPSPKADPQLRFDTEAFRKLRDMSGVGAERLSEAAGLTVGQSRRLLTGTYEPTLGQVIELASVLGVSAASLCTIGR
jgi:transcriptional regulator with XRE-family HTH domain